MLHTKFQGHQSIGSGEEDFKGHVTQTIRTNFQSKRPWRLYIKFEYNRPSSFRGEVV